jgi:hypothetical protein
MFGRLRAVNAVQQGLRVRVRCVCQCGQEVLVKPHQLRSGETKSCGCLKRSVLGDATRTHGRANSRVSGYADRTYGIWQAMRDRCSNPNRKDYGYYGGKGIRVCRRWEKFENFLADMGEAPAGLTLDRIDGEKNYTPNNCRWATRAQQTYNSTAMHWVEHEGQRRCLADWMRVLGLAPGTYYSRLKRGATVKEALGLKEN